MGYGAASGGNFLQTFRDSPSVPSSGVITQRVVVISYRRFETTYRSVFRGYYAANGGNFLPTFRDNLSVCLQGLSSEWW